MSICIPKAASQPLETRDARATWLKQRIHTLIADRPHLRKARIGIAVRDLSSRDTIFEHNANARYNIASNSKIITTAAALATLGPDHRFRTDVFARRRDDVGNIIGPLYVRGQADPSLDTGRLYQLAQKLYRVGVRQISGGIIIDDSYFDRHNLPPKFDEQKTSQASYRAPVGATSIHHNALSVYVRPARAGSGAAFVSVSPPGDYLRIVGTVNTNAKGPTRIKVETRAKGKHLDVIVSGTIAASAPERRIRRRVPSPHALFGSTLRHVLQNTGIRIAKPTISRGKVPKSAILLTTLASDTLASLVRSLGKYSNNYVAEMLLKTMGRGKANQPATWSRGIATVHQFLHNTIGLRADSFTFENGSGLFRASGFSPHQVLQILEVCQQNFSFGPDLVASLAIGGKDGTLRRRLRADDTAGQIRAKTGTLATVSALSGYAGIHQSKVLAFSILINNIPRKYAAKKQARSLENEIAQAIVALSKR